MKTILPVIALAAAALALPASANTAVDLAGTPVVSKPAVLQLARHGADDGNDAYDDHGHHGGQHKHGGKHRAHDDGPHHT